MRKRMREKTLYLSEKENEMLMKKSNKLGLSQSEYIRVLLNDYTPIKIDENILSKHKENFKMIGNGLNAVARDTNRYGFVNEHDLNRYLLWLNDVCEDIKFNLDID